MSLFDPSIEKRTRFQSFKRVNLKILSKYAYQIQLAPLQLGPEVIAVVSWTDDDDDDRGTKKIVDHRDGGKLSFETLAIGEAPVDEWVTLRGVIAFNPLPDDAVDSTANTAASTSSSSSPSPTVKLHVEVTERGYAIEARNLRAVSPTSVAPSEAGGGVRLFTRSIRSNQAMLHWSIRVRVLCTVGHWW